MKESYYQRHKEEVKARVAIYRANNKEAIKDRQKNYYLKNKDTLNVKSNIYKKTWRKKNKDKIKLQDKLYHQKNKQRIYEYRKNKIKIDIKTKLARRLRDRLRCAIKNNQKTGSAVKDLGCTISELKIYLESKFQLGMTWGNYGKWHIDHFLPLSKFDLTNREELLKAVNYTNLQPLWATDNLSKSNKIY